MKGLAHSEAQLQARGLRMRPVINEHFQSRFDRVRTAKSDLGACGWLNSLAPCNAETIRLLLLIKCRGESSSVCQQVLYRLACGIFYRIARERARILRLQGFSATLISRLRSDGLITGRANLKRLLALILRMAPPPRSTTLSDILAM